MRPRLELTVKTTVSTRTSIKTRLLLTSTTVAFACIVGAAVFIFGNFGASHDVRAAIGSNMGFENGTTEWTAVSGSWTSNTTASYVRAGSKSVKVNVTNGSGNEIKNLLSTITVPLTGTYYIAVTAYGKASDNNGKLQCGVANTVLGTVSMGGSYTTLSTSSFTKVTGIVPVSNGVTYSPILSVKRTSNGSTDIYLDDVSMYLTTSNATDATNPNTPTAFNIASTLGVVNFTFTDGSDAGSGPDGVLILRQSGVQSSSATLTNGVAYSTSSTVGPTASGSWNVAYNGPSASASDAPGNGVFTYLVYQKDKAGNFSSNPARLLVLNGSGTSQTISSNFTVDGLFVQSGASLTVASTVTLKLNSGSTVGIDGTVNVVGTLDNNGTLTMKNGSVYNHQRNAGSIPSAVWQSNSTCNVTGMTSASPTGLDQTFGNFNWNCTGQTTSINFPDAFSTSGNFTVTSTGAASKNLKLFGDTHIAGNINFASGTTVAYDSHNAIYLDGTLMQQTVSGANLGMYAVRFSNAGFGIKLLNNLSVTNSVYLDAGTLDLNGLALYTADGCTVYRSGGAMLNGTLSTNPLQPGGKYNLEYNGTCTSGLELTSSTAYLNDLTMDGAVSDIVTLDKTATVNGNLTLTAGKIKTTSSYAVYVLNTSHDAVHYEEQDGYVFGSLRWAVNGNDSYDFAVGSANYTQNLLLKLHNIVGVTYITVTFNPTLIGAGPNPAQCIANGTPINTLYNAGYWSIHPDNQPTAGTYEVKIKGKGGSNPPASPLYGNVIKRANSAAAWAALGTQDNVNNTFANGKLEINVKDLTSFSDFGIGYGNTVLPITLSAFTAEAQTDRVQLYWKTSAELNNEKFILERSADGKTFETVNEQPGAGTSTSAHTYQYLDVAPLRGVSYYRLKQMDFDGGFTYSPLRPVAFGTNNSEASNTLSFSVYPNPSTGLFNFNVSNPSDKNERTVIRIYDVKGQLVTERMFEHGEALSVDITSFPPGTYMASLSVGNDQTASQQIVKQR